MTYAFTSLLNIPSLKSLIETSNYKLATAKFETMYGLANNFKGKF